MSNSPIRVVDENFTPVDALLSEMTTVAPDVPRTLSIEIDFSSVAGQRILTLARQAREAGASNEALDSVLLGLSSALDG